MRTGTTLCAKQIDHGRSEIWLEANGQELTARRNLATNEVVNVTRRHCMVEAFEAFYKQYHVAIGHVASLDVPTLEVIADELRLEPLHP